MVTRRKPAESPLPQKMRMPRFFSSSVMYSAVLCFGVMQIKQPSVGIKE